MPTTDVFKTPKGAPAIELGACGIVDDETGVPLERAAQRMHELQEEDGTPLTGKKLLEAANEYADRTGLTVGRGRDLQAEDAAALAAQAAAEAEAADNDAAAAAPDTKES